MTRDTTRTGPVPPIRVILILGTLCAFPPLATDMYLPAFAQMARALGVGGGGIEATLSVFFIGLAVGQAIYGPLIDRYGRRKPLLIGIAIYVLTSLLSLLTTRIELFVGLRFLQAVGGCAGMIVGRAVVSDLFDERESARVLSLMMVVMTLAPIVAPVLGGQILAVAGWRMIFVVMLAFGLFGALLVWFGLPETLPASRRRNDGLAGVAQGYWNLLSTRGFIAPTLVGGLAQACMFAFITGSPFVFIRLYGVGEQAYGGLFAAIAAGLILAAQGNRIALKRWSPAVLLGAALALNAVSGAALVAIAGYNSLAALLVPLWLSIASLGFIGANATTIAMAASGQHLGSASALIGVVQFGCAFLVSSLVAGHQNGTAYPMTIAIAASGLGAGLIWVVFEHTRPQPAPAANERQRKPQKTAFRNNRRNGHRKKHHTRIKTSGMSLSPPQKEHRHDN
ncbi:multidrug effflux MFS transporter [Methylococcus sp. ANG]|uniref:multidrug effflux MFS transporter n=1 Tax=Methylococcus sp. ANG TaxID=3231903 RepID=UPI00345A12B6